MSYYVNWNAEPPTWISKPAHDSPRLKRARTLVICFNGTGDAFDNDNSNVVQLTSLLKRDDPTKQMVYHQTGTGTGSDADARFEFVRNVTKGLDSMFDITLGAHVLGGYEFLMENYHEGDSICIFGFSRGAYTARALAGMIHKVGLLPASNRQQLPYAYQIFADQGLSLEHAEEFKSTFALNVTIQFVGLWDTVESVGIFPRHLPFVSNNTAIRCFRHAVALDEHRAKFLPSFMHFPKEEEKDEKSDSTGGSTLPLTSETLATWSSLSVPRSPRPSHHTSSASLSVPRSPRLSRHIPTNSLSVPPSPRLSQTFLTASLSVPPSPRLSSHTSTASDGTAVESVCSDEDVGRITRKKIAPKPRETDAQEVWFAGAHTDVGGGPVDSKTRHSLARISLRWMIRECWKSNAGIIFDANKLQDVVGMDVDKANGVICNAPKPLDPLEKARFLEGRIRTTEPNLLQTAWQAFTSPTTTLADLLNRPFREDLPSIHGKNPEEMPFLGEDVEELLDALSPMNDQLQLAPSWWLLELVPFWMTNEKALHTKPEDHVPFPGLFCAPWNMKEHLENWVKFGDHHLRTHHFTVNYGRGREVYKHIIERGMSVHPSVLTRLEAVDQNYRKGTYVPLIQPNIPGYNSDHFGPSIRPMTGDEWIYNRVSGNTKPWFYWWTPDSKQTGHGVKATLMGLKEARAKLKLKRFSRTSFDFTREPVLSPLY